MAVVASGALAIACYLGLQAITFGADPQQSQAKPAEPKRDASHGEAERKLLADLEAAIAIYADHSTVRDSTATWQPLFAPLAWISTRLIPRQPDGLAGHPLTPEIAAVIDEWCRVRRTRLKVTTCAGWPRWQGPPTPTPGGAARSIRPASGRFTAGAQGTGGRRERARKAAGEQPAALVSHAHRRR